MGQEGWGGGPEALAAPRQPLKSFLARATDLGMWGDGQDDLLVTQKT